MGIIAPPTPITKASIIAAVQSALATVTPSAKVEEVAGLSTVRIRSENERAYMRGLLKVKTGETLAALETLLTVTAAFFPPNKLEREIIFFNGAAITIGNMVINTNGTLFMGQAMSAANAVYLDGLNWPLN